LVVKVLIPDTLFYKVSGMKYLHDQNGKAPKRFGAFLSSLSIITGGVELVGTFDLFDLEGDWWIWGLTGFDSRLGSKQISDKNHDLPVFSYQL
jgi:hypothetical protein